MPAGHSDQATQGDVYGLADTTSSSSDFLPPTASVPTLARAGARTAAYSSGSTVNTARSAVTRPNSRICGNTLRRLGPPARQEHFECRQQLGGRLPALLLVLEQAAVNDLDQLARHIARRSLGH